MLAARDDELDVGDDDDASSEVARGGGWPEEGTWISLGTTYHATEHVTNWRKLGTARKLLGTGEPRNTSDQAGERDQHSPVTLMG